MKFWNGLCLTCIAGDGLTLVISSEHWLWFSVQGSNATSFEPRLYSMTTAFIVDSISFSALLALAFGGLQVCCLLRPAISSMSFPDPPLMVLDGHRHTQSHFQLFWEVQSNFHLLLMCWVKTPLPLLNHGTLSILVLTFSSLSFTISRWLQTAPPLCCCIKRHSWAPLQ